MSAEGDDIFYGLERPIIYVDSYTLYAAVWREHDTDHPGVYPIIAVSVHFSEAQRRSFQRELFDSYDQKWGRGIPPPTYFAVEHQFPLVASPEFYQFTETVVGSGELGVVITAPNVKYLPRLGLTEQNPNLDTIIAETKGEFIEELMSLRKVLDEIRDDTERWYSDLRAPRGNATQWQDIFFGDGSVRLPGSPQPTIPQRRHLILVRTEEGED